MEMIYADGVANMTLIDGVVRIELVTIVQADKEKQNVRQAGSLAMSLPALLRTHGQLGKMIDKMVEDGILQKKEPQEAPEDKLIS